MFYLNAGGRREGISLNSIMKFVTGAEEELPLGFAIQPAIYFVEAISFLPTANTCICRLNLTVPGEYLDLPEKDFLFKMYEYAFLNTYFGLE